MKYLTCKKMATFGFVAAMINGAHAIDPVDISLDSVSINSTSNNQKFFDIVKELEDFRDAAERARQEEEARHNNFIKSQLDRDAEFSNIIKKLAAVGSTKEGLADLKKFMADKSQQVQIDVNVIIKQVNDAVTKFDIENKKAAGINTTRENLQKGLPSLNANIEKLRQERDVLEAKLNDAAASLDSASAASSANATSAADVIGLQAQVDALTKQIDLKKQIIKNNLALKARTKDASIDAKNAAIKTEIDGFEQKKSVLTQKIEDSKNASTFASPQDAQTAFDTANKALIAKDKEVKSVEKQRAAIEERVKKQQETLKTVMHNANQYQRQLESLVTKLVNTIYGIEKSTPTDVPAVQLEQPKSDDLIAGEDASAESQNAVLSDESSFGLGNDSFQSEPTPASAPAVETTPATTLDSANKFIDVIQTAHKSLSFDFKNPKHQQVAFNRCETGVKLALNGNAKVRSIIADFMNQNAQATGVSRASANGGLDASAKSQLKLLLDTKNTLAQLDTVRIKICGK